MKALLDTDVLLDVALRRDEHFQASAALLGWGEAHPVEEAVPWDRFVDAMYGIQGNDPIERAPQPVLETRDELG
jgi:hypothetical protein